jgi:hypothetical protein
VNGSSLVDYSQSVIKIGAVHTILNVRGLLPYPTTISHNTQKEPEKLGKLLMAGSCGVKRCSLLNSPMIVKLPVISE